MSSSKEMPSHKRQSSGDGQGGVGIANGNEGGQAIPTRFSPSLIDLEHLSPEERGIIMTVLERDEMLREKDQERVKKRSRKLKNELHDLRKKSAVNAADENDNSRVCMRCREPLGLLFNAGDTCPKCQHRICKGCQVTLPSGSRWLCTICHKNLQLQLETGDWYYSQLQVDEVPLFGSDLVKASLAKAKHSHTDPTTIPVLTASDLRSASSASSVVSSQSSRRRGGRSSRSASSTPVRQDSRSSRGYASGRHTRQDSRQSASSGSEQFSVNDPSEVDAVVEPISGFTFQRVSFRRDRRSGNKQQPPEDSTDQGKRGDEDMGCICSQEEPACIAASGLPEDDQDYYRQANGPSTDSKGQTPQSLDLPVISVNDADAEKKKGEDEDIDQHFRLHGGTNMEARNKHGIPSDNKSLSDAGSYHGNTDSMATAVVDDGSMRSEGKRSLEENREGSEAGAWSNSTKTLPRSSSRPASIADTQVSSSTHSFMKAGSFDAQSRSSVSSLQRRLTPSTNLTKGSSASMTSLYSQAGEENYGKYVITGDINFGLSYNYKTNVFEVKVKACRDLAPVDAKKIKSDPYVKTYLLPDKTKASKRKTHVRKGTVNPQFDTALRYHISQTELETRTLSLTVWNNDAFGRNDFLGEVQVCMDSVKLDEYKPKWHQLQNKSQSAEGAVAYKGDLVISMMYSDTAQPEVEDPKKKKKKEKAKKASKSPQRGEGKGSLYVRIVEAKNLVGVRMGGSSNPFVKGYLEPDRSKTGKHKTSVLRSTCNPLWDHVMKFESVSLHSLRDRCLELTVWDHETLSSNEFLGGLRLNLGTGEYKRKPVSWNDATGEEQKVWEQMLKNPGKWNKASLTLRPSMVSRLEFT